MARRMASAVATLMLKRSISWAEAAPIPKAMHATADQLGQTSALAGGENLAVAQASHAGAAGWKDDGRGHHWSCQGSAAGLVNADEEMLLSPDRPFAGQRRARGHRAQLSRFSRIRAALPLSARR